MKTKAIDKTLNGLYNQIATLEATKPFYYYIMKRLLNWEIKILERRRDNENKL